MQASTRHKNRSAVMAHTSTSGAVVTGDSISPAWPCARIRLLGKIAQHAGAESAWRTAERHFTAEHPIVQAFKQRALNKEDNTIDTCQSRSFYRAIPVIRNFKRKSGKIPGRRNLCQKRYKLSRSLSR